MNWRTLLSVLAFTVAASSCGGSDQATETTVSNEDDAAVPAESTGLVATTASGGQLDFGALEGQDFVLWFWAPW